MKEEKTRQLMNNWNEIRMVGGVDVQSADVAKNVKSQQSAQQ